jgi:transposase
LKRIVQRCAGLDVHKASITACVRIGTAKKNEEPHQEIREFDTTTRGLLRLRDWLAVFKVELVGMEATGAYWKPVYYMLEENFECWLLNARHMKNVPGKKTDVKDAEWICQLVEHSLVRPSFVPPKEIRELRDLTRHPRGRSRSAPGRCSASKEGLAGCRDQALFGGNAGTRRFGAGDARCLG